MVNGWSLRIKNQVERQTCPSLRFQTCGRAAADPQGRGGQSLGALGGTGWWIWCGGQSAVAQPLVTWTSTNRDTQIQNLLYTAKQPAGVKLWSRSLITVSIIGIRCVEGRKHLNKQESRSHRTHLELLIIRAVSRSFTCKMTASSCDNQKAISILGDHLQGPTSTSPRRES